MDNYKTIAAAIAVAAMVGFTAWFGIELTRGTGDIAAIWITNGFLAGIILTVPRRHWPWLLASGFIGNVCANLITRDQLLLSVLLSLCNTIEIAVGCAIARAGGNVSYLGWRFPLKFLAGCVLAGPLISAILASTALALVKDAAPFDVFKAWLPADVLGMATFAPLVLCLRTSDFASMLKTAGAIKTSFILAIVLAIAIMVFYQSSYPFLFMTTGALVLAAFQLGRAGLSISICMVAVIAIAGTVMHHGPFNLVDSTFTEKVHLLQFYLLSSILMTFPVAISVELTTLLRKQVDATNHELRQLSLTDTLTKLPNRRAFDETLEREWRLAARNKLSLSLLILDVDHFKGYNDAYGHSTGDECLAAIGQILRDIVFRPLDLVARIGGEEFAAILPDTNAAGVRAVAERLREIVFNANLPAASSHFGRVTISVGVNTISPGGRDSVKTLFDSADSYLYRAKQNGRNRVEAPEQKTDSETIQNIRARKPTKIISPKQMAAQSRSAAL